jgi:uncharacterized protein YkwD
LLPLFGLALLRCGLPHGGSLNPDGGSPDAGTTEAFAMLEDRVLVLVNQRRSQGADCGSVHYPPAPAMSMNASLRIAARLHSQDMANNDYFSHVSQDGRTFDQRIRSAGYASSILGENIAAGLPTAEGTMNLWMNSPGHCVNVMDSRFRAIGVGYGNRSGSTYTHYWTQDFGGN